MKIYKLDSGIKYAKFNVSGTRTPMIVMNGWSVGIKTMRPFVKKLAKALPEHPVFVISTDSALYEHPDKRSNKVVLLKGLIEYLKIDRAHFIAHSEAAVTATHYSAVNRNKVSSLQLIGPAGLTILNAAELKAGLLLKVRQDGWRAIFGPVPIRLYLRLLMGGIKQFTFRFKQTKKEWRAEPQDHSLCEQLTQLQQSNLRIRVIIYKQDELFKIEEVKSKLNSLNYMGEIKELAGTHDEPIYRPTSTVKTLTSFIN